MGYLQREDINKQIHHIRERLDCDFAALALPGIYERAFRWEFVSGNLNDRYKQMLVKRGKGLPGLALLYGRCMIQDMKSTENNRLMIECPLMLAEGLKAAAAIPLPAAMGLVGVLIIGTRQEYNYSVKDLSCLQECAQELAPMVGSPQLHNK